MTVGYFVRSKVVLLATLASLAVPALSFSEEQATPSGVEEAQVEEQTLAPEVRTDVEPPPSPPVFSSPPRGVNRYDAMRAAPGTAVLNFNEAGIRDILRTIGELTGKNFILAPGVNARISVQTARPVPREEVFGIFESLLEVNGLAAVRSGKYYKIVPAASARQHSVAAAEDFGKGNPGSEEGMTSLVVPVEFISAADLMAVLKPMVSAAGNVTAVPRSNTVIITDSAPNVRNHLELIRILDVDAFERFEVSLLPLKNVDAKTMHRELAEVLAALGMGKDASQLAVIPIERLNSLVIISAPGGARESVARWVESLDVPSSSEQSSLHIYYVKNDKASNLKALLEQVYEGKKSIAVATASSAAGQPNTAAEAQAVSKSVSSGDKGISIYIYEPANALVVRSSQGEYLSVLEILKELDRPPRQVLIDALIAEVKLDESTRFGIQWSVLSGDFNIQHNTGLFSSVIQNPGAVTQTPIGAAAPAGLSVFATDSSRFFAAIQALATDGKVDILSNPHVVADRRHRDIRDNPEHRVQENRRHTDGHPAHNGLRHGGPQHKAGGQRQVDRQDHRERHVPVLRQEGSRDGRRRQGQGDARHRRAHSGEVRQLFLRHPVFQQGAHNREPFQVYREFEEQDRARHTPEADRAYEPRGGRQRHHGVQGQAEGGEKTTEGVLVMVRPQKTRRNRRVFFYFSLFFDKRRRVLNH